MADPEPEDVTDAELAVLEVLWERGSATRRQLADALYPGGGPAHYTTVQKLIERLQTKGHVVCQADTPVPSQVRAFPLALARYSLRRPH